MGGEGVTTEQASLLSPLEIIGYKLRHAPKHFVNFWNF